MKIDVTPGERRVVSHLAKWKASPVSVLRESFQRGLGEETENPRASNREKKPHSGPLSSSGKGRGPFSYGKTRIPVLRGRDRLFQGEKLLKGRGGGFNISGSSES